MASAEPVAAQRVALPGVAAVGAAPVLTMAVEVVFSPSPQRVIRVALNLPAGTTALAALRASGLAAELGATELDGLALGLWGRLCPPAELLQDGDRLELLRPLLADPMDSRRQRLRRDGRRKLSPRKRV